jgi:hypothetical protein
MKKKKTSSTSPEKASKKSSSKPVPKPTSNPKKKNPLQKYSKPKTELVDYFPRGSGPNDDYTSNIGIINPSQKSTFLSKKRKTKASYIISFMIITSS